MSDAQVSLSFPRRQAWLRLAATALLGAVAWLPLTAQAERVVGSGKVVSQMRALPPFEGVELKGSMDLVVSQGNTQRVEVKVDDNLQPYLETEVRGSGANARLEVRWKRGSSISTRSETKVMITVPRLTLLSASGSGDMLLEPFETPTLTVNIAGSSDTRMRKLSTGELKISIAGSGDVEGVGTATRVSIDVAGSGDVRLRDMKADDVTVTIAGSGDASVHADKSLQVRIAGSGDVNYTGNAPQVNARVAGSGSVNKR